MMNAFLFFLARNSLQAQLDGLSSCVGGLDQALVDIVVPPALIIIVASLGAFESAISKNQYKVSLHSLAK